MPLDGSLQGRARLVPEQLSPTRNGPPYRAAPLQAARARAGALAPQYGAVPRPGSETLHQERRETTGKD